MNFDLNDVQQISNLTSNQREKLIHYYAKLSEQERIKCEELRYGIYMTKRDAELRGNSNKYEFNYACLLLAIFKMQRQDPTIQRKRNLMALDSKERKLQFERKQARIQSLQMKRSSPKKAFLVENFEELWELKNNSSVSWSTLSLHIAKTYPKIGRINTAYIRDIILSEKARREALENIIHVPPSGFSN